MRILSIFLLPIFIAACSSNSAFDEKQVLEASIQTLNEVTIKKSKDTLLLRNALQIAYPLANKYANREHDSLIAETACLFGNAVIVTKPQEARSHFEKGLRLGLRHLNLNEHIITLLYRYLALTYYYERDFKTALIYFDSIKIVGIDSASQDWKVHNLMSVAECYQYLNDYKSAEKIIEEAEPLAKKWQIPARLASFYGQYASCLRKLKQYKKAISKANIGLDVIKTMAIRQSYTKNDSLIWANVLYSKAYTLHDSGDYKSAELYYKEAMSIYHKQNNWDNCKRCLTNMGIMYRFDKQFDKAEKTLTEGINLFNKNELTTSGIRLKASFYVNRSEVYLETKQYKKAIADHDSAIYFFTLYEKKPSLTAVMMQARPVLLSVLSDKAKASIVLAENGQDTEGYQNALKLTQQIIELADEIRADYFSDDAKLTLANDIKPALEKAIGICQKLYQKTKDKQYLEKAFGFVEYSRGMVLYETTRLDNHLPSDLKAKSEALKKREGELIAKNDVEKLQAYLRDKRQFREKIKALNRNLMASVGDLQKGLMLNNQTALIEYFVGDSSIFVFSLLHNDLIVNELPKTTNFEKQIEALRTEITEHKAVHDATNFEAQSYALYCYLLKQTLDTLPKDIHQLIIAPDGVLNYLPFDVLVNKENLKSTQLSNNAPLTKSFKKSKFILWDYTISYAYSANLLLEQKKMKKDAPELFAGFASKYADKDTSFTDAHPKRTTLSRVGAYELPSTKEEVNKISALLGGKAFLNEVSTEGVFKKEANRYKILHFAMHSLTDDKDASLSRLLFTLTPQDSTNDNDLTAAELQTMRLNADLAVLSACNTGFGTLNKGEGVMSLARAFFHAGVPSTVTSLWEVDDSKTRDIMIEFYKNLKKGRTKDEALTEAKRTYLENMTESGTANPYFWAGFIPIGNMDAMDLSEKRPLSIWGILAGLLAFSGLVIWFWKRKIPSNTEGY